MGKGSWTTGNVFCLRFCSHTFLAISYRPQKGIHHNKQKEGCNLWLTFDGDNDIFSSKICVKQSYS